MEWVETTGRSVEEALERALDQLGVAEKDAEVVVLEEPKSALLGLRRVDARLRVRVRPVQARAKRPNRRPQPTGQGTGRRSPRRQGTKRSDTAAAGEAADVRSADDEAPRAASRAKKGESPKQPRKPRQAPADEPKKKVPSAARSRNRGRRERSVQSESSEETVHEADRSRREPAAGRAAKEEEMTIEGQAALAEQFVRGVVERFGLDATVSSTIEDEHIRVTVDGDGVGFLIGPRGTTIEALQELTRTVVQRRAEEGGGRVNVDVGGYRVRRAAALAQFAQKVAREVAESGSPQALEPMNAADRKVVHDAVHELSGVSTSSEGDDPRRYVVIRPASGSDDEGSAEASEVARSAESESFSVEGD